MLEFIKKLLIAEFDGRGTTRKTFILNEILIIFSIFVFVSLTFFIKNIFQILDLKYCFIWTYCIWNEKYLWKILEISEHIFFIFSLLFLLKLNFEIVERFSFLRFWRVFDFIFQIILTFIKLIILALFIYFSLNLFYYFQGTHMFLMNDFLSFKEIYLNIILLNILFFDLVFLLFWVILWRKK